MARTKTNASLLVSQEIKQGRRLTYRVTACGAGAAVLAILQAWFAASMLAIILHHGTSSLPLAAVLFAIAALARAGLMRAEAHMAFNLGIAARRRLRNHSLNALLAIGPAGVRGTHSADLAGIVVDRVEAFDGLHARWIPAVSMAVIGPALGIIAGFIADPLAGVILAIAALLVPVGMAFAGIGAGIASQRQFTAMSRLQTRFIDRIRGISTIILAGRSNDEAASLAQAADELRVRTMRVIRVAFVSSTMLDLAAAGALIAIAIRFAAPLRNHLAATPLALFCLLLVPIIFAPLRGFAAVYQDRMTAQAAAERLADLPAAERLADLPTARAGREALRAPQADIRTVSASGLGIAFEQVCFRWSDGGPLVLDHLSFRVPAGEMLLLLGPSGVGKSSIIDLLLGFARPTSGRVTINGADIASIVPASLARMTSWIGQHPMIFAGSVADNIRFARPEAPDAEWQEAARLARVTDFAGSLPVGFDTMLGEGGYGLSGGQVQRIAIARAFLKDSPLLLLDEPTAHLDPATEREVLDSLRRLAVGRTVILATHSAIAHEFARESGVKKLDLGALKHERLRTAV
ncbi:MAG: thiol reductant ABC exporter subunit CydD [Rhodospirillales bacterium 20-60-12]|nr:MAG: thiol reductant ABC exporter subunit CydD [Rhodospirillales bacterium 20-60-12]HQT66393.1 thiol reductant ABC exporter subunit CydD [Acetobacteraceae bacterium]